MIDEGQKQQTFSNRLAGNSELYESSEKSFAGASSAEFARPGQVKGKIGFN